jgi:hypothetical protein
MRQPASKAAAPYRRALDADGIDGEAAPSGIDGVVRGVFDVEGEAIGDSPAGRLQPARLSKPRVRMNAAARPWVVDFMWGSERVKVTAVKGQAAFPGSVLG